MKIKGKMLSGFGQGAFFTQLDWVREQCQDKLRFLPSPGTLNLYVESQSLDILKTLREAEGISLIPPTPEFCRAKCFPVSIGSLRGAIIMPEAEHFTDKLHGQEVIEIMAPVNIKETLLVKDGDEIWVELETL
ncbi:CTP-dependent riboflavin kinase [Dehalococcoidia bacterium]|nr:CTP-dependent riboflavin kinase [Dehalococcoidia bacterium]